MSLIHGDCIVELSKLKSESVNCCVTSPPYFGLRDYGVEGQLGLEQTPKEFIDKLVSVFKEVKRVLKYDGTCWIVVGDSYNARRSGGHVGGGEQGKRSKSYMQKRSGANVRDLKSKDLIGIPWMLAFALRDDGWYLRQDIIWHKPNPMPESVLDRCTKSHEYVFLLSKSYKYYYDSKAIREAGKTYTRKASGYKTKETQGHYDGRRGLGFATKDITTVGRNKQSVWPVKTSRFKGAHFATFPPDLIEPMIKAGCPESGVVLDPFFGAGTVGVVAEKLNRKWVGIELNKDYIAIAQKRINV